MQRRYRRRKTNISVESINPESIACIGVATAKLLRKVMCSQELTIALVIKHCRIRLNKTLRTKSQLMS